MRKTIGAFVASACVLAIAVNSISDIGAIAQEKNKERSFVGILNTALPVSGAVQEPGLPVPPPPPGGFFAFGMHPNNAVVKDAPFSGEMVSENIQTLADGNRIVNRSSTSIYRDSQGRTRQEFSFKLPDASGGENKEHKTVQIFDPVSGASYSLDPQNRTAHKFPAFMGANDLVTFKVEGAGEKGKVSGGVLQVNAGKGGQPQFAASVAAASPVPFGAIGAVSHIARPMNAEPKSESLGKQTIEGVEADGTRITHTFPGGAIGNEKPIEIVHEFWYSQELQMQIMTKLIDPRMGESTQRLTKINRSEPDASLFQIPSDYTINEAPIEMKLREKSRKPNQQ